MYRTPWLGGLFYILTFIAPPIRVLLADREFIGEEWFRFLIEQGIPFIIRIKQNSMVEGIRQGYPVPVATLLGKLGRRKAIENYPIVLWSHHLFVSVEHRKEAKEPMIVVSNREFTSPLKLYRWRWGIESLFECLKTRGFRMEETHMIDPTKIEKLFFILAIAVCWAYKIGELQARKVPITIKKHGRKLKSIFRLGLDLIRRTLFREDESLLQGLTVFPYLGPYRQRRYYVIFVVYRGGAFRKRPISIKFSPVDTSVKTYPINRMLLRFMRISSYLLEICAISKTGYLNQTII